MRAGTREREEYILHEILVVLYICISVYLHDIPGLVNSSSLSAKNSIKIADFILTIACVESCRDGLLLFLEYPPALNAVGVLGEIPGS